MLSDKILQVDDGKTEIDNLKKQIEALNDVQEKRKSQKKTNNASVTSSNDSDKSE